MSMVLTQDYLDAPQKQALTAFAKQAGRSVSDVMDRLTDISALRTQIGELSLQQREVRGVMLEQQRELAEVRRQLQALIQIQGQASRGSK